MTGNASAVRRLCFKTIWPRMWAKPMPKNVHFRLLLNRLSGTSSLAPLVTSSIYLCRVKRSFKPRQNERDSVNEVGKKGCNL